MIEEEFPYRPYNYCDYRCEKCGFNSECPVFKKELQAKQEGQHWTEVLKNSFRDTKDMLLDKMKEMGLEITTDDEEVEKYEEEHRKMEEEVEKKPALRLAYDYMSKTLDFLEKCPSWGIIISGLWESGEDLGSYCTLIPVKLHRTLMSLYEFVAEEDDFHLVDAFLTSRVVYKALHKSMAALEQIKKTMTEVPEELLELERLLLEIRTEFRREFPFEILLDIIQKWAAPTP
jgi:hypothetical protein